MKSSSYGFFILAAVVLIFVKESEANMTATLAPLAQIEKLVSSKEFQIAQEEIIMNGTDTKSLVTKGIIETIRQAALRTKADGVPTTVVNTILDAILVMVRLTVTIVDKANETIDAALKLRANPVAAIDALRNGLKVDEKMIFIGGGQIHEALGAALAMSGGVAQPELQKSIISIQKAVTAVLEAFESIEEIGTIAFKAGENAIDDGIKAAREILNTSTLEYGNYLIKASQYAFKGVRNTPWRAINPRNLISGIYGSLTTNISTTNPEALKVISRLDNGLTKLSNISKKKMIVDAANNMNEGLITSILETEKAISYAKKALQRAAKMVNKNTGAAISIATRGIEGAEEMILSGSAGGYLGVGAAGKFGGKKAMEGLIPAIIELEYGREAACKGLKLAGRTAFTALRAKGEIAAQGIKAAIQTCEAAKIALFTQYADSGEIALEVLQNL